VNSFLHPLVLVATVVDSLEGYPISLPLQPKARVEFVQTPEQLAGGWRVGMRPHLHAPSPSARKWKRARREARHRVTPCEELSAPTCPLFSSTSVEATLHPDCSLASRGALALSQACTSRRRRPRQDSRLHSDHPRTSSQSVSACPRGAECAREAGSCRPRRVRPRVHVPPAATTRETNSKARQNLCRPIFFTA
jgi:hypothetical protein